MDALTSPLPGSVALVGSVSCTDISVTVLTDTASVYDRATASDSPTPVSSSALA